MGKVIRADKDGVQMVRARDIVPGDVVEVSGEWSRHLIRIKVGKLKGRHKPYFLQLETRFPPTFASSLLCRRLSGSTNPS